MKQLTRITHAPSIMGGRASIRGLHITVGMILALMAAGRTREQILEAHPDLEPEDLDQALAYAAGCMDGEQNGATKMAPVRIMGLHRGAISTTSDFDAPLPDDFWAGTP
jgi:uncharacterized protein (DUF433 family)